jgi:hypothetical protein
MRIAFVRRPNEVVVELVKRVGHVIESCGVLMAKADPDKPRERG